MDGNTLEACLLIRETFRLYGINTPELNGPERVRALKARERIQELVGITPVTATLHGLDKFGRRLAVFYAPNGECINELLIAEGLAVAWNGQGKAP